MEKTREEIAEEFRKSDAKLSDIQQKLGALKVSLDFLRELATALDS